VPLLLPIPLFLSLLPFFLALCVPASRKEAGRFSNATLVRLSDYLTEGYRKGVRPVRNWTRSTTVAIDLMVYAILSVDEKNQVLTTYIWYRQQWTDEFLFWNPEDFDNVKQVSVPISNVWMPDILINEFVDVGKSPEIPYVYVGFDGVVQNYKPIQVMTACSLNIYNFPFDVQNCSLTFQSWLHTIKDINISLLRTPEEVKVDKSVFMNQGEWELLHILSKYNTFSIDEEDYYAEIKFNVVIRRRPLFYTVSLLLPSIFLMVMDIVGFYLPPDSGERVSFKITLLLGYSVFLIIVSDTLPATAIGTPLIGVYFVVCMALLVISLTETVLIVRLVHKQDLQPHVPDWVKRLVLEKATALLCVRNRHKFDPISPKGHDLLHVKGNAQCSHQNSEVKMDAGSRVGASSGTKGCEAVLDTLLAEISSIRQFLEKREEYRGIAREWLQVGYVLDVLLFRIYLTTMLAYSVTLGILWSVWQYA
uniref:5-hydroxytryptamine receptor 3A n=1 Tax=Scleropages formosus TaxID=113540 RepID=A0A8C9VUF9_SCLFO